MKRILPAVLCLASLAPALRAQPSQPTLPEAERTRWFREAKFGLFIHWGVYSLVGRHEWSRHMYQIPQDLYDTYARRFNPVNFNADAWVDLAKQAGVKYMVITSKHHDGFSIYRSQVSNYDMEITPYPGDPLKQLAEACKKKSMRLGFYHSIMDWHHPDYRPRRNWEEQFPYDGGNLDRYLEYMKAQLKELLTGYGDVAVLWFDGEWEHSNQALHSDEIYDYLRKLQPNILINDRLYNRQPGSRGDFGTPEQFVPATGITDPSGKPALWESCVTINSDSWGYNRYATEFKTERDLIRMLVEVVSKGGNLLLNVGPRPDGTIPEDFQSRLRAMGRWLETNDEAIYGTTASPFAKLPFFGRATAKGNTVYLHVFQWPVDGKLRVPGLSNQVVSARLLAKPAARLAVSRDGGDVLVDLPGLPPDEVASVVALELDGAPALKPMQLRPDAKGVLRLGAESCEIETDFGQRAKKENFLDHVFVTNWTRTQDVPYWPIEVPRAGRYKVSVSYAAERAGTPFVITAGGSKLEGEAAQAPGEWVFKTYPLGEMRLEAGQQVLKIQAKPKDGAAVDLEAVTLTPAE